MSGGERIWINEALTRAIALYLSRSSGRSYDTLFCDEADGALDNERKRMFMQMKREVLRLGGYAREFFVSQTPELTQMADVVIDLAALSTQATAKRTGAPALAD
jgi:exonuclease SbcC